MTLTPFHGRCHTCGHDHDAEDVHLRDLLEICTTSTPEGRWEAALRQTWQMVDPLNPPGTPGSYARGHYQGMVDALNTLRANLKTPNDSFSRPQQAATE